MNASRELLRRLAAHDEPALRAMLRSDPHPGGALDRLTRALVQLSALLAADAATPSLRLAAETAAMSGADDAALVHVLETTAATAGDAQASTSATRLAAALEMDLESRPTGRADLPRAPG